MMMGWDDAIGAALKIIDKVIPDPAQKAAMQLEIMKAQQSGALDEMKAEVDDRVSARLRESAVKDHVPAVLATLSVVMFLSFVGLIAFGYKPDDSVRDGFWMLAGVGAKVIGDVYGYYFGSSKGSQAKDLTISRLSGGK